MNDRKILIIGPNYFLGGKTLLMLEAFESLGLEFEVVDLSVERKINGRLITSIWEDDLGRHLNLNDRCCWDYLADCKEKELKFKSKGKGPRGRWGSLK